MRLRRLSERVRSHQGGSVQHAICLSAASGADLESVLAHGSGQGFRDGSRVFRGAGLADADYDLGIGSASHGVQTARMLEAIEAVLVSESPAVVLVYGDTNSTLAGALAAAKLHIPVAHVEAGLRSYDRRMPDEVNRVLSDHVSRWLFCPTDAAASNLKREGIVDGVHVVGDVMYELAARFGHESDLPGDWGSRELERGAYLLTTIHRAENTDDEARLLAILRALAELSALVPVVLPIHPRTRKILSRLAINIPERVHIVDPLGYRATVAAEAAASVIVTDSRGVQKEAFWLGVPCVTVRDETEWSESLESDRNILAGADSDRIITAVRRQLARGRLVPPDVPHVRAGPEIIGTLLRDHVATS
jgi:UDP-GlcNAc3NAcA epimerase